MKFRCSLLLAASSLTLTACGMMPGNNAANAEAEPPEEITAPAAETLSTPGLTVSTDDPETFSRQVGRYTTYARTDCNSDRERRAAFNETLEKLRANAVEDGADYLRVLGTGSLESRGLCHNDMFQLTGVAFREENIPQGGMTGGQSSTDSLTARLEELDALLERGLLSDSEYEQLRERVLNEAY